MTGILKRATLVGAAFALVLVAVLVVFPGKDSSVQAGEPTPTPVPEGNPLQIVTLSPLIVETIMQLVRDAGVPAGVFDNDGMSKFDVCILAYALRTATGDAEGAAELNTNGDAIPCAVADNIPIGAITPADFALLDPLDGEQVSENSDSYTGGLFVLVFDQVGFDHEMTFSTGDGVWWSDPFTSHGKEYVCDTAVEDADCEDIAFAISDDGVVVAGFSGPLPTRGPLTINVRSGPPGFNAEVARTLTVVGDPDDMPGITVLDSALDELGEDVCRPGGEPFTFANLLQIIGLSSRSDAGLVLANIVDSDGTALTQIPITWRSMDEEIVITGFTANFSLLNSGLVIGPNLVCGVSRGVATIQARVERTANDERDITANQAQLRKEVDITVVGRPAQMVLYADPPIIDCNGTNTTTVSAVLLDNESNPSTASHTVHFDVQTLGTANPIDASTAAGVASSVVTPFFIGERGVTVIATGPLDLESSTFIGCSSAAGAGTAPPPDGGGGPTGTITPPDTGSGAEAPMGGPWWSAVALGVVATVLAGTVWATRRV